MLGNEKSVISTCISVSLAVNAFLCINTCAHTYSMINSIPSQLFELIKVGVMQIRPPYQPQPCLIRIHLFTSFPMVMGAQCDARVFSTMCNVHSARKNHLKVDLGEILRTQLICNMKFHNLPPFLRAHFCNANDFIVAFLPRPVLKQWNLHCECHSYSSELGNCETIRLELKQFVHISIYGLYAHRSHFQFGTKSSSRMPRTVSFNAVFRRCLRADDLVAGGEVTGNAIGSTTTNNFAGNCWIFDIDSSSALGMRSFPQLCAHTHTE